MPLFRNKALQKGQELIEKGAWFLAPLSWIWGGISWCRNALYDRQLLTVKRVPRVVVSIGNLVAGGTGKTPFTLLLASQFSHRKIAILSRGYGAIADEALLLRRRLPHVEVFIGKCRAALAEKAVQSGAELLLLDDGFQSRELYRDFDFVLLYGSDPFGKGHYLPWGFLRDSPKRLAQASHVFAVGGAPLGFPRLSFVVARILDLQGKEILSVRGERVGTFCGIARPASFKKTVTDLGAEIVAEWRLFDHERPSLKEIATFAERCKKLEARAILCTEKDAVKIPPSFQTVLPLLFVEGSLKVTEGREEWEKLIAKIDQKIDNTQKVRVCS